MASRKIGHNIEQDWFHDGFFKKVKMPPKEIDRTDKTYVNFVREIKKKVMFSGSRRNTPSILPQLVAEITWEGNYS